MVTGGSIGGSGHMGYAGPRVLAMAATIELRSGSVSKTSLPGRRVALPVGQGVVEVVVRFPARFDVRAMQVTVQPSADGATQGTTWQVEMRPPPAPEAVAFALRGAGPADLI